jgi:ankyrin repeat protein
MQRIKDYFKRISYSKFLRAIKNQDIETVDKYLSQPDHNVNQQSFFGETPISIAIEIGNNEILEKLIKAGADVNYSSYTIKPPLALAIYNRNISAVDILIQSKANVNIDIDPVEVFQINPLPELNKSIVFYIEEFSKEIAINEQCRGLFFDVAIYTHNNKISAALNKYSNYVFSCNNKHKYSTSLLTIALREDLAVIASKLIQAGADINKHNEYEMSPLEIAIDKGQLEFIDGLIQAGYINKPNNDGSTPLCIAIKRKNLDIIKHLIQYKADINYISPYGTALTCAAEYNTPEIVKYLLDNGANPNLVDRNFNSALMAALSVSNYDNAKIIIDYNPDILIINKFGQSAKNINQNAVIANILKEREKQLNNQPQDDEIKVDDREDIVEPGMPILFSKQNQISPSAPIEETNSPCKLKY